MCSDFIDKMDIKCIITEDDECDMLVPTTSDPLIDQVRQILLCCYLIVRFYPDGSENLFFSFFFIIFQRSYYDKIFVLIWVVSLF